MSLKVVQIETQIKLLKKTNSSLKSIMKKITPHCYTTNNIVLWDHDEEDKRKEQISSCKQPGNILTCYSCRTVACDT